MAQDRGRAPQGPLTSHLLFLLPTKPTLILIKTLCLNEIKRVGFKKLNQLRIYLPSLKKKLPEKGCFFVKMIHVFLRSSKVSF